MIYDISTIIENSGDSVIQSYRYEHGCLIIELFLDDLNETVVLTVSTDVVVFNSYYLEKSNPVYRTCRLEFKELSEIITVEKGFYIPPKSFKELMYQKKNNCHLAYGLKAQSVKYLFSVIGYDYLISCVVCDFDSVKTDC